MTQHFQDQTLRPWELLDDLNAIRDATFTRCTIRGPAVLMLHFNSCDIINGGIVGPSGNIRGAVLWEIVESRELALGSVPVVECVFTDCLFELIGFAVETENVPHFWESFPE